MLQALTIGSPPDWHDVLEESQNELESNIRYVDLRQTRKSDAIATKASEINLEIAADQAANSNVTAVDDVITVGMQVSAAQGEGREINFIATALEVLNDIDSKNTVKDESIRISTSD